MTTAVYHYFTQTREPAGQFSQRLATADTLGYPWRPGEVAERSKATVLKTVDSQGSGGSNPSLSAIKTSAVAEGFEPPDIYLIGGFDNLNNLPQGRNAGGGRGARLSGTRCEYVPVRSAALGFAAA